METGAVLVLDYLSFPADNLYGVEKSVPYTYAYQCKDSKLGTFLGLEYVGSNNKGDDRCYQRAHREHLPVILEDKHAEELAEIYPCLCQMPFMPYPLSHA